MQSMEEKNPLRRHRCPAAYMFGWACVAWLGFGPQMSEVSAENPPPSGKELVVRNSSIDSGSGRGEGGQFAVNGTTGQPDAGVTSGEVLTVRGGFWTFKAPSDRIFRNGFE